MLAPDEGATHPWMVGEAGNFPTSSVSPNKSQIRFLRERYARAIERGDDTTAERLRQQPDRALNAISEAAAEAITSERSGGSGS